MPTIENKQDWWKAVDDHWDNLLSAINTFHPASTREDQIKGSMPSDLDLHITAAGAEVARRMISDQIKKNEKALASPGDRAIEAMEKRDWETLYRLFSNTWMGVPESLGAWSVPSFGALCDLCSEAWVFQDEVEEKGVDE